MISEEIKILLTGLHLYNFVNKFGVSRKALTTELRFLRLRETHNALQLSVFFFFSLFC